jgi:preprotein translocase subunit SecG
MAGRSRWAAVADNDLRRRQSLSGDPVASGGIAAGRVASMELTLQIILVVTSVLVVLLVLLHRAKGGGLSTLFGGGVQSSLSGSTVVEKNLDRLTLFVTGIWLVAIVGMALRIKYNL